MPIILDIPAPMFYPSSGLFKYLYPRYLPPALNPYAMDLYIYGFTLL